MADAATILVVMGVSGVGKTTIARALAERLGWMFEEGDALHPAANVAKMASGQPLNDDDRRPWLDAVAEWIDARRRARESGVITCSALKRQYRQRLIGDRAGVRLVHLRGDRSIIAQRMADRVGHFMPASLLDSQLATLEPPTADERPITVGIDDSSDELADRIILALRQGA
ncbi:MAG: gluconokinase [Planctomycetota bacterium]